MLVIREFLSFIIDESATERTFFLASFFRLGIDLHDSPNFGRHEK